MKPGVDEASLRAALLRGDYDAVMPRLPVRAGDTLYVPGGTLHSFGGGTMIYELEQTSNIQQHAMPWRMEDGSEVPRKEEESNIDKLLEEIRLESRPAKRGPWEVVERTTPVHRRAGIGGAPSAPSRG